MVDSLANYIVYGLEGGIIISPFNGKNLCSNGFQEILSKSTNYSSG